jgi:hypothetical protein
MELLAEKAQKQIAISLLVAAVELVEMGLLEITLTEMREMAVAVFSSLLLEH